MVGPANVVSSAATHTAPDHSDNSLLACMVAVCLAGGKRLVLHVVCRRYSDFHEQLSELSNLAVLSFLSAECVHLNSSFRVCV